MSNRRKHVRALHIHPKEMPSIEMWGMAFISASRDKNGHRHYSLSWSFDRELLTYKCNNGDVDIELPLDGVAAYLKESRDWAKRINMVVTDMGRCYALADSILAAPSTQNLTTKPATRGSAE